MSKLKNQYNSWILCKSLFISDLTGDIETIDLDSFQFKKGLEFPGLNKNLRLGKVVERFLSFALNSSSNYRLLEENFQIIKDGITLGELDFIIEDLRKKEIFHLELVHKFYLFKPGSNKVKPEDFVGPNLNDSLDKKLLKLKEKQFPIIHESFCSKTLLERGINTKELKQKLLFTGSVFIHHLEQTRISILNKNCIHGVWMRANEFLELDKEGDQYYLPQKSDWLGDPNGLKVWAEQEKFWKDLRSELQNRYSPMVWKKSKEKIQRIFVVWWD